MGRPVKDIELTRNEQSKLELMASRPKSNQRDAERARIVLACSGNGHFGPFGPLNLESIRTEAPITEGFKVSKDPIFVEKVRDIVGLHLNPPEKAVVLCVDEKSQCQALERTQPILPMRRAFRSGRATTTSATAHSLCSPPTTPRPDASWTITYKCTTIQRPLLLPSSKTKYYLRKLDPHSAYSSIRQWVPPSHQFSIGYCYL